MSKENGKSSYLTSGEAKTEFEKINKMFFGIVAILRFMVGTIIIMGGLFVIDSFHINSATYKEYSEKMGQLKTLRENMENLYKINYQNQEIIIKQLQMFLDI